MIQLVEPSSDLIVFLDSNIVLEGKPLAELPWEDIAAEGVIRVLIVPKAMEEIDAKKRDGRLGPHARAFNRLLGPSVTNGRPVMIKDIAPRVELQMATCSKIPWHDYDELDPEDGDSRIVAEALNVRNVGSLRRLLVSHDIKPLVYAQGRDLPVYQASDAWLRSPEPNQKDKEIHRLKQQLAEFKKDEPDFKVVVELDDSSPLNNYQVKPLDQERVSALINVVKGNNRKRPNGASGTGGYQIGLLDDYDSSYDDKYSIYVAKTIPDFALNVHKTLELLFNQRALKITVSNSGNIRADNFAVNISTSDGLINNKVLFQSPSGPAAPIPRSVHSRAANLHRTLMNDLVPVRVGRHEFETTLRAAQCQQTEAICEDFRCGQEYQFEGFLLPSPDAGDLSITVTLTAKNMRGEYSQTFQFRKSQSIVDTEVLMDISSLKLKKDYRVKDVVRKLYQSDRLNDVESY